ncbi:GLPGLI family protein [Chryseobacterium sp.]|uniref:GLPGLI family protein n=1 Tax=Chryseobacterium sp. TaxID=1871047 RepID=UPI0028A247E0|nr:GLPGLI family protein [Chryseobacterium sp.]
MKYLSFIFLYVFVLNSAQTHRFIYEVSYKPDSTATELRKTNYHLDINPNESFYYERNYFISDSIEIATGMKVFEKRATDLLSKNLQSSQYTVYSIQNFEVFQLKDKPKMTWTIEKETKEVSSLRVQKATAKFGGRKWTAWFAKEIPFQEGPYKFHGLPGMIVELYDNKENFHFTLVKSENFKDTQNISFYKNAKQRGTEIPLSKYQSLLMIYYKDPLQFINRGQLEINENNKLTLDDGRVIYKPEELKQYSLDEQKRIKKYNNPIEVDKAVKYPVLNK